MAITPQQIALAAEAFNRAPGLSPIARRLGIELVNRSDRNDGRCKPCEARLALSLGCDERSIRRAKVELQQAGFLVWITPAHHKRCWYQVAWSRLVELAQAIKRQIREASVQVRVATHRLAVKTRRVLEVTERSRRKALKPDRTKMSGNPTTHIQSIFPKQKSALQASVDAQRDNHASGRLWEGLTRHPAYIAIMEALTPELEEQAVKTERFQPGSGITFLLTELKGCFALEEGVRC